MKIRVTSIFSALAALSIASAAVHAAEQLGSQFTYQGQLGQAGAPVNASADFEFSLWDADAGGAMIGPVISADDVEIVDGLFTVDLDFGGGAFNGDARWLEIGVRSPAGAGVFTTLAPRQPLTATPYSIQTRGIFVDDAGHVGIGTTFPADELHVNASGDNAAIRLSKDDNSFTSDLIFSGSGSEFNIGTPTANRFRISSDQAGEILSITPQGNVGIGTTAPGAKLGVAGDMRVQGRISSSQGSLELSGGGSGMSIFLDEDGGSADTFRIFDTGIERFRVDGNTGAVTANSFIGDGSGLTNLPVMEGVWEEDGGDVFYSGGSVGIGTDTPGATLDVDGTMIVRGTGAILDQAQEEVTESLHVPLIDWWQSFTAGADGRLTALEILVADDNPNASGTVEIRLGEGDSGTLLASQDFANFPVGSEAWVTVPFSTGPIVESGQQYTFNFLSVHGFRASSSNPYQGGMLQENETIDLSFRTYLEPPSTLNVNGNLTADGRIGIGTDSPTEKLHILNGNLLIDTNSPFTSSSKATIGGSRANGVPNIDSAYAILDFQNYDNNDSTVRYVGASIRSRNRQGSGTSGGSDDGDLMFATASDLTLEERMVITSEGNVGIGTASPIDSILDVEGDMHINNNDLLLRGGSDRNHGLGWYGSGKLFNDSAPDGPVLYGHGGGVLGATGGGQQQVLTWRNTGRVGIGTDEPMAELDVRGDIQCGDIRFGDSAQHYPPAVDRQTVIVSGRITQAGDIDDTFSTSGAIASAIRDDTGDYTITFVAGTFAEIPIITVTASQAGSGDYFRLPSLSGQSTTSFHVTIKDKSGEDQNAPFQFIAIGER